MHLQPQDIMRRDQQTTRNIMNTEQMTDRQKLNNAGFSDYRNIEANRGTDPEEVSEAHYWEMLEVLPPQKWTRDHDSQSFYVMEALTGDLHEWIVKTGNRYFALIAPRSLNHNQIMEKVSKAL